MRGWVRSEHSDDGDIRLGLTTHWRSLGEQCYAGLGQRLLKSGADEIGILDVREVSFAVGARLSCAPLAVARDA